MVLGEVACHSVYGSDRKAENDEPEKGRGDGGGVLELL